MSEDESVRADLPRIAKWIDAQLPIGWCFVVLATPFGKDARMNYISNAERADVVRLMYEFIEATKAKWGDHQPELSAAAEDEQIARLRQRVAELERELQQAGEIKL
jgi:hypothetical protein